MGLWFAQEERYPFPVRSAEILTKHLVAKIGLDLEKRFS